MLRQFIIPTLLLAALGLALPVISASAAKTPARPVAGQIDILSLSLDH